MGSSMRRPPDDFLPPAAGPEGGRGGGRAAGLGDDGGLPRGGGGRCAGGKQEGEEEDGVAVVATPRSSRPPSAGLPRRSALPPRHHRPHRSGPPPHASISRARWRRTPDRHRRMEIRRPITGRPPPAAVGGLGDGGSFSSSSQALVRMKSVENAAKNGQNLGSMVRKFMEKRSKAKDPGKTVLPPARVAEDLKKTAAAGGGAGKSSNLAVLHRKLFQRGKPGDATPAKALTEVKSNTRTLAMVLRSERELLDQNKEYEAEILELRSLLEDKEREVEKLKDLCLKQRQEIKALKDAILFPDVMNAQLQVLLEKQGSELKQAKLVIPTLQKQVTSLTGQLQCLAEGLAEVKADNYAVRSQVDGHGFSPRTPAYDHESNNSWEFSSGDQMTSGIPDDMFLKDMNPCLTPCFPKTKSKEFGERMGYKLSQADDSFGAAAA